MNIGIIGAGAIGSCLASKFVQQGHDVVIANSRGPASLTPVAEETGARAGTVAAAIMKQDVIIVSIPQKSIPALPKELFAQLPADTVVIDTCNYYPLLRDGNIPALDQSGIDSLWVQQQLGVPITKVFNSIVAESLGSLGKAKGEKDRIALAVSGDGAKAKQITFKLAEESGFDPFDNGDLSQSWKQQPGSAIYCRDISLEELKKRVAAMGNNWPAVREAVTAKRRADEALMQVDYPAYLQSLTY